MATDRKASAHPTKAFFVRMLTRDISLSDCILDLIDNSIDAAWANSNTSPKKLTTGNSLSSYRIDIDILGDQFRITDNCHGITLDEAADYAFTFGRDEPGSLDDYSVGVYGIGMKRAVFKLGNVISIRSTTSTESFLVPINVERWLAEKGPAWDFDIDDSEPLPRPGLEVVVEDLNDDTADTFADPEFTKSLRRTVARDYVLPLMQGLEISINDSPIEHWALTFKSSTEFSPMRESYSEGSVGVEIIAGMVAAPPNSVDPSERAREDVSGWYVLCNGRVVVAADRTKLTVWGKDRMPSWHPQYEGFVGVVMFSSKDPSLLPMTTTKRSVDSSSSVFRAALPKMRRPTRAWIDYTNARKNQRDLARQKENAAKSVSISEVQSRKKLKLPADIAGKTKEANVLYSVPLERMRALAKAFGKSTMAYKEVGLRAFDYSYERLVSEDE